MLYKYAKNLNNKGKVTIQATGRVMQIVKTRVYPNVVAIVCEDGNWYLHKEVQ